MRFGTVNFEHIGMLKQVRKDVAKKAFLAGKTVWVFACNMMPYNLWTSPCPIERDIDREKYGYTFDVLVNDFTYYNCDNERGKYPVFFVKA